VVAGGLIGEPGLDGVEAGAAADVAAVEIALLDAVGADVMSAKEAAVDAAGAEAVAVDGEELRVTSANVAVVDVVGVEPVSDAVVAEAPIEDGAVDVVTPVRRSLPS
jgi:hypothetical protein